ncbi:MAG: MBL fold metallo-hydrolase [Candidatus Methanospirare jalkutatii]|nr:MBL fold metallo-hydrolase [Candidatus Methanospirare jalkutatii]MCW7077814.1 MBL fold metallo-hydrolase [Candidatus Methanoxibalbensis ujae]
MDIKWHGHACFEISAAGMKVVTDPYDSSIGYEMPAIAADIVTVSHDHYDHNNVSALAGEPAVVRGAGEHVVKGIRFVGIETFHDTRMGAERGINTVFVWEMEGIRLCHLGDLGHVLDDEQVAAIRGEGDIDVLFVPVGGVFTVDAEDASKVVEQISPRIAIPMHYKTKGLKLNIADEREFLRGKEDRVRREEVLTITRDTVPTAAEAEIVVLERWKR